MILNSTIIDKDCTDIILDYIWGDKEYAKNNSKTYFKQNILKYIQSRMLCGIEKLGNIIAYDEIIINVNDLGYIHIPRDLYWHTAYTYQIDCRNLNPIPEMFSIVIDNILMYHIHHNGDGIFDIIIPPGPWFFYNYFRIIPGDEFKNDITADIQGFYVFRRAIIENIVGLDNMKIQIGNVVFMHGMAGYVDVERQKLFPKIEILPNNIPPDQ